MSFTILSYIETRKTISTITNLETNVSVTMKNAIIEILLLQVHGFVVSFSYYLLLFFTTQSRTLKYFRTSLFNGV